MRVRVALKEKDARIVPDMGVTVAFLEQAPEPGSEPRPGVRVPARAVVSRDGGEAVFVLGPDGTVELRRVEAGPRVGDAREVVSGLAPGETVVVDPPESLADGAAVATATQ